MTVSMNPECCWNMMYVITHSCQSHYLFLQVSTVRFQLPSRPLVGFLVCAPSGQHLRYELNRQSS